MGFYWNSETALVRNEKEIKHKSKILPKFKHFPYKLKKKKKFWTIFHKKPGVSIVSHYFNFKAIELSFLVKKFHF